MCKKVNRRYRKKYKHGQTNDTRQLQITKKTASNRGCFLMQKRILTQKHTTVCVFCEHRRFCNIFFHCLHRSSFRKPICQFAINGNTMPFFALLETTVTGKNSPKMHTKKAFLTFAVLLAYCRLQLYKISRGNYQLKKVSAFPSMSFVVAPWSSKTR